jgi:hypothetical protein
MFVAFGVVTAHRWLLPFVLRRLAAGRRRSMAVPVALWTILVLLAIPVWHVPGHLRDRTDSRNAVVTWIAERVPSTWAIVAPRQLGFDARPLEAMKRTVNVVDFAALRDPAALQSLRAELGGAAVILAPRWGADTRFPGQELAPELNDLSRSWRVLRSFGTNDVLVNYSYPNPWGDPAFSVAVLQ